MAFTEKEEVCFTDHINRRIQRTQFENSVLEAKRRLEQQRQSLPPKYREKPTFTRDPTQLKGTFLSTALQRSNVGLGFTIIGGDDGSFLQVNRVVSGGPAAQDGKIDTGDVIVYINDICVLGATQADMVKLIQSVPIGQSVTLVLCRGDPLPGATAQAAELLTVTMVKGSKGFGFTITDSPTGQRVKQVLEPGSQGASGLMAGDLILEVNQQQVAAAGHGRVVELLKECPVGAEATLLVQRAGTGKIAKEKRRIPPISESLWETDSTDSGVSMKSASSMCDPPNFNLHRKQRAPFSETESTDTNVSMKSASSMYEPPSFNLHRKQSCAVCEEAVKDPILLPCGHWSCTECSHSFWDEHGLTADDPCKKCGRRSEREKRDQDLQSVLLEKTIKRVEMETERIQAEKEKLQAEKETFQAEKEKFQAEKEKSEFEKRKLALEIQSLELNGKYTNYDQSVVIPKIRIPYL